MSTSDNKNSNFTFESKNTTMKKLTAIVIATLFLNYNYAQENEDVGLDSSLFKTHFAGVHAGASTGLGFSYRWFPKKFGFQVTAIPVFNGNNNYFVSSGGSFLLRLNRSKRVDLFVYQGNHFIFQSREEYVYEPYDPNNPYQEPTIENVNEVSYNLGVGAGINIHLFDNMIDISLQTGYGIFDLGSNPRSNITGEIGIYYCF